MSDIRQAEPFEARQCPECDEWIFCADGPFAEGDRTKTVADWNHWAHRHLPDDQRGQTAIGFPYFRWNETTVEAVKE